MPVGEYILEDGKLLVVGRLIYGFPDPGRGYPQLFLENPAEIVDGLKPKFVTYLLDDLVCGQEHLLGAQYLQIKVVLDRWHARVFFEHLPEIGITDMILLCKFLEIDLLLHILPDHEAGILDDVLYPLAGKIPLLMGRDHVAEKLHDHPCSNLLESRFFFEDVFKDFEIGIYKFLPVSDIDDRFAAGKPGLLEDLVGDVPPETNIVFNPAALFLRPIPS